jgi:hypothetical protein
MHWVSRKQRPVIHGNASVSLNAPLKLNSLVPRACVAPVVSRWTRALAEHEAEAGRDLRVGCGRR